MSRYVRSDAVQQSIVQPPHAKTSMVALHLAAAGRLKYPSEAGTEMRSNNVARRWPTSEAQRERRSVYFFGICTKIRHPSAIPTLSYRGACLTQCVSHRCAYTSEVRFPSAPNTRISEGTGTRMRLSSCSLATCRRGVLSTVGLAGRRRDFDGPGNNKGIFTLTPKRSNPTLHGWKGLGCCHLNTLPFHCTTPEIACERCLCPIGRQDRVVRRASA